MIDGSGDAAAPSEDPQFLLPSSNSAADGRDVPTLTSIGIGKEDQQPMSPTLALLVKLLTSFALAGLLFDVGLRTSWRAMGTSLARTRMPALLLLNFGLIPLLATGLATLFQLPAVTAMGMLLLAAAPFAPVVPIFARYARADLSLAAALTSLFPILSVLLTPLVCVWLGRWLPGSEPFYFNLPGLLLILGITITLPLLAGVTLQKVAGTFAGKIQRPVALLSEIAGAGALVFVVVLEFPSILHLGWQTLLAMVLLFEVALWLGHLTGGPGVAQKRTTALGAGNRNIALAILVAVDSFPDSEVVAVVVGNGLLLILLGLAHSGAFRWLAPRPPSVLPVPDRKRP